MPWSALLGGLKPVTQPWTDDHQPLFEIRWNRVYTLPDFVRFVHKPHIWAGVACQECHGPVEDDGSRGASARDKHGLLHQLPREARSHSGLLCLSPLSEEH